MVSLALDKESNWTYRFTSLASLPKKPSGTEAIAFAKRYRFCSGRKVPVGTNELPHEIKSDPS